MSASLSPQRKKLAPRNKNLVDSKKGSIGKGKLSKTVSKKLNVFKEKHETKAEKIEASVTAEVTPENYWKDLAEERRIALENALEENKDLAELLKTRNEEHKTLQEENETLSAENNILREKALKVNELESLIAELVSATEEISEPATEGSD